MGPAPGLAQPAYYYFDVLVQTHSSCHRSFPVCLATLSAFPWSQAGGTMTPPTVQTRKLRHSHSDFPQEMTVPGLSPVRSPTGSGQACASQLNKTTPVWVRKREGPTRQASCAVGIWIFCEPSPTGRLGLVHRLHFGEGPTEAREAQDETHLLANPHATCPRVRADTCTRSPVFLIHPVSITLNRSDSVYTSEKRESLWAG